MHLRTCMPLATTVLLSCLALGATLPAVGAEPNKDELIREALRAAPPEVANNATVMDWDHKTLRQGNGNYTCMPSDPDTRAKGGYDPMCLDQPWMAWLEAYVGKKPFKADRVGVGYMLAGDSGASNTDPYATGPTAARHGIVPRSSAVGELAH